MLCDQLLKIMKGGRTKERTAVHSMDKTMNHLPKCARREKSVHLNTLMFIF